MQCGPRMFGDTSPSFAFTKAATNGPYGMVFMYMYICVWVTVHERLLYISSDIYRIYIWYIYRYLLFQGVS